MNDDTDRGRVREAPVLDVLRDRPWPGCQIIGLGSFWYCVPPPLAQDGDELAVGRRLLAT